MITVREFKNLFINIFDENINMFINQDNKPYFLDFLSYEINYDSLNTPIYKYILKPVSNGPTILNKIQNIKDIFINGKDDYDLIEFYIIDGENIFEIKIKHFSNSDNYIDIEFEKY